MNLIDIFNLGYRPEYLYTGLIVGFIIGVYAFFRLNRILYHYNLSSKKASLTITGIVSILIFISCYNIQSTVTILLAYLFISSVIADIIRIIHLIIKGIKLFNFIPELHRKGILALIIFILIVSSAFYCMNHIESTNYNITTNKINESYTILYISDLHYSTIQDPQVLSNTIEEMNSVKPDLIILGGDIVDERTSNKSMHHAFEELGRLNSTYGTYFIYGNHDTQPNLNDYDNYKKPFSNSELEDTIQENGIEILNDSVVTINNNLVLVGRADTSFNSQANRLETIDLLDNVSLSDFIIILDHQPLDSEKNSKLCVDLEISGHTHGGQIFPYGLISDMIGTLNYGEYSFNNMIQIVSSGFAGWGVPFRNEAKCEYVTIQIN